MTPDIQTRKFVTASTGTRDQGSPRWGGSGGTAIDLLGLLAEAADALSSPGWDPQHLDAHLELLDGSHWSEADPELVELVVALRSELRQLRTAPHSAFLSESPYRTALIQQVDAYRERLGAPRYLYHGTILARLNRIYRDGLKPAEDQVWRDGELGRHCTRGIFFADRWRGAAFFADVASHCSCSVLNISERRPVIIRLDAANLTIEPDPLAVIGGSWMVRGVVSVQEAEVFIAPHCGLPTWRAIAEVIR